MEATPKIGGELRREKPGHARSPCEHKVELVGLLINSPTTIGSERPASELCVRLETTQGDERIFDSWRKADAMGQDGFVKLQIDHRGADRYLPLVPVVA